MRPIPLLALALLCAPLPAHAQTVAAVACGSPVDLALDDGSIYRADQLYEGGNDYGALGGLAEEPPFDPFDDGRPDAELALYAEHRTGASGYVLEVPNGDYELTLHFAPFHRDGPGIAPLEILVESDTSAAAFDGIAAAAKGRPVDLRALVTIADGACDIALASASGDHDIAAIGLRLADPLDLSPPAAPDSLIALDSYGGVLLRWTRGAETDLAGYRVLRRAAGGWESLDDARRIAMLVVPADTTTLYGVCAYDLYGNESDTTFSAPAGPRDPADPLLPRYQITLAPADLTLLNQDPHADIEVPGLLLADGVLVDPVALSYRGKSSRAYPKKSWNIDLGASFLHGSDDLILRSNWDDPSVQRELLTLDLLGRTPAAHPLAFPIRVEVNGEYRGVHVEMERVDRNFVARQGWSPTGRLYRVASTLETLPNVDYYRVLYESELAGDWERADIIELTEGLARVADADILPWLEARVDLDQLLDVVCHQIVSANRDWNSDDYFLFRDGPGALWKWIPWDVGESWRLGGVGSPIHFGTREYPEWDGAWNRLWDRVFEIPALKRRYTERLRAYSAGHLAADSIMAAFDTRGTAMLDDLVRDSHKRDMELPRPFLAERADIAAFIEQRGAEMAWQLDLLEPEEHVLVQISELIPVVADSVAALEVRSLADRPFVFEGFALSDDPGDPLRWPLPADTIAAGDYAWFTLPVSIAAGSWLGLARQIGPPEGTVVDSLTLPDRLAWNRSYGRFPDTSRRMRHLDGRTPGAPNQWTSPLVLDLRLDDAVVAEGDPLAIVLDIQNEGDEALAGEARLELSTWDGIHPLEAPLFARAMTLSPGRRIERTLHTVVPAGLVEPYGYHLDLRFLAPGEDEWGAASAEIFLVGDPDPVPVLDEVMAINDTTHADEAGEFDDWVEILNPSDQSIVLQGLYLTDDVADDPLRWPIPTTQLAPGAALIVWCDNDLQQGPYHASFKLSGAGEEIAITASAYALIDHWSFGPQTADVSIGRYPSGQTTWLTLDTPTPGAPNVYSPR